MRKTIAGLEEELRLMKEDRDQLLIKLDDLKLKVDRAREWATRETTLTDRLLNILEFNAREGKGYASPRQGG